MTARATSWLTAAPSPPPEPADVAYDVVYEDEQLMVVNKPAAWSRIRRPATMG